jgi:hypothetical protein
LTLLSNVAVVLESNESHECAFPSWGENLLAPRAMFMVRVRLYIMGRAVAVPPVTYTLSMPAGLHHAGVVSSRSRAVTDGVASFAPRVLLPDSRE